MRNSTLAFLVCVGGAAVLFITGCSHGSAKRNGLAERPSQANRSSSNSSAASRPASGSSHVDPSAGTSGSGETLSPKERTYVKKHTPKGVDPDAVLQGGQQICARLSRAHDVSIDELVSALATGQIAGADDAITYLCPSLLPELRLASRSFTSGSIKVGTKPVRGKVLQRGVYRTIGASSSCVWTEFNLAGKAITGGRIAAGQKQVVLTIGTLVTRFDSQGCTVWVPKS